MSILGHILFWFVIVYVLSGALYLLWFYLISLISNRGDSVIRQGVDSFFVKKDHDFQSSLFITLSGHDHVDETRMNDVAIVIDYSGSMYGESLKYAKWGANEFVKNSNMNKEGAWIGVASFDHKGSILCDLSSNRKRVKAAITGIPEDGGGTAIVEGLRAGLGILENSDRKNDPDVRQSLILLTDGGDTSPDVKHVADEVKDKGIRIFCIGLGNVNEGLLKDISGEKALSNSQDTFYTGDPEQLPSLFSNIRQIIVSTPGESGYADVEIDSRHFVFLGSLTGQLLTNIYPLTWMIPWLRPEGEEIRFRLRPRECIGLFPVNKKGPDLRYKLKTKDGKKDKKETYKSKCYVMVSPYAPLWFWAVLIHPLLWPVYRSLFCRKEGISLAVTAKVPDAHYFLPGEFAPVDSDALQVWNPTLCIALGGGGIETALRFQAYITDASGGNYPADDFEFLYIDTCDHTNIPPSFGPVNMDLSRFICIGRDLYEIHHSLMEKPEEFPWYAYRLNEDLDHEIFDTRQGAHRNRLLGRLSLHQFMKDNKGSIESSIKKGIEKVKKKVDERGQNLQVMITCTGSGGTGGAIFQDIAHILLHSLEEMGWESQPVRVIIPDTPVEFSSDQATAEKIFESNRAAFLMELERIKTTIRYLPDLADYPGAEALQYRRFTGLEYLVQADRQNDNKGFSSAASLALSFATGKGGFNDKHNTEVVGKTRESTTIPGLVYTAITSAHAPITLLNDYCEAKFILHLLDTQLGIRNIDGRYAPEPRTVENVSQALDLLFNNIQHPVYEMLDSEIPILFPYIPALTSKDENIDIQGVVVSALEICPDADSGKFIQGNSALAVSRLVEWTFSMLNRGEGPRLSTALTALNKVENKLYVAIEIIRRQSLNGLSDADLLLFTKGRLSLINNLFASYRRITQILYQYLVSWSYSLAEGFPQHYSSLSDYIGTARRYARRVELIQEKMKDYQSDGDEACSYIKTGEKLFRDRLSALDEGKIKAIGECIQWDICKNNLEKHINERFDYALSSNPFRLSIFVSRDNRVEIKNPGEDQEYLEGALQDLARKCYPWIFTGDIHLDDPQEPVTTFRERNSSQVDLGTSDIDAIDAFSKKSSIVRVRLNFNANFKESEIYRSLENTDPFMRGHRNHVYRPDMRAAMLQRIISEHNRPLTPPCSPLVVYLMEDLHRLQRFLYLHLKNRVKVSTFPKTARQSLCVELHDVPGASKRFYLTPPEDEPDQFNAAVRFVLVGTCTATDATIPVEASWRPSAEEVEILKQSINRTFSDFMESFRPVLEVMSELDGYFSPIGEMTTHFLKA